MKKHQTKLITFIIIILVLVFILYQYKVSRISKNSQPVLFEVSDKENGLNRAIQKLEDENLIHSSLATKIQARINNFDRVYAGSYILKESMSSYEILDILNDPKAADQDLKVQLTEGYWAKDMADKLAPITGSKSKDYIDLWNDKKYVMKMMKKYDYLPKEILEQKDYKVLLEGYLYPDTYRINPNNTIEEVSEIILKNGQQKFNQIKDEVLKNEFSTHELFTLSSIVEYEANTIEDMKKVAGVFMNRLKIDMPLQSSVTVCYTLYDFDDWTDCESAGGTQIESPYNTYRNKGLPPGPILNPSIKSIEATLNYDDNDYFYFIADVYEILDGEVHYQETYEEHEEVRMELLGY